MICFFTAAIDGLEDLAATGIELEIMGIDVAGEIGTARIDMGVDTFAAGVDAVSSISTAAIDGLEDLAAAGIEFKVVGIDAAGQVTAAFINVRMNTFAA